MTTKIAHLADTHLGFRQYGLIEREEDFYNAFDNIINDIIEEDVDFVLHSGDLFETSKPPVNALLAAQKGFNKLYEADIPIYTIAGNHDILMRRKATLPHRLFENNKFNILTTKNNYYVHDDVFIGGFSYVSKRNEERIIDLFNKISEESKKYENRILMIHGSIDKYFEFNPEFTLSMIPSDFTYYAMGHLHKRIKEEFKGGYLSYPGSTEVMSLTELKNYNKSKKGYNLITLNNGVAEVEYKNMPLQRELIQKSISYPELDEKLEELKEDIVNLDKKPVVYLTIKNGDFDRQEVFQKIESVLGNKALTIRKEYKPTETIKNEYEDIDSDKITAEYLIKEEMKDYGEDISDLALDLYKQLSVSNKPEAYKIAEDFFEKQYNNQKGDDE